MTKLLITRGLPASGKTTRAKAWVLEDPRRRVRINRDDLRNMLKATTGPSVLQRDEEVALTDAIRAAVLAFAKAGKDVICDDTNLRPKYVREWRRWAVAHGLDFEVLECVIELEESIANDAGREHPVGEEVIRRMGKYLVNGELAPVQDEEPNVPPARYLPNFGKRWAIIVDIDGTVALADGRSPYDLSRVGEDLPNVPVIEAVEAAWMTGLKVVFCSGREEVAREATTMWLKENVSVPFEALLMRPTGDMRKDAIVKRELFDKHIRDRWNVRWVYDDRSQVVQMWRELGLACFQVAPGDF